MDRGEVFSPAEKQGQRFQILRKRHGRMVKQRKKKLIVLLLYRHIYSVFVKQNY